VAFCRRAQAQGFARPAAGAVGAEPARALPSTLVDFVDKVVPELQRRGVFRADYSGRTLRDHLGLRRPENRYVSLASEPVAKRA